MAAYARAGGNNKERRKTRGYGRLPSRAKAYQLSRRLLYRLLGGRLILRLITYYKIPERTGEIPRVIGGGSQLLVEGTNATRKLG